MVVGFASMTIPLTLLAEEALWWEGCISGRGMMQSSQRGSWKPELLPPAPLLCW